MECIKCKKEYTVIKDNSRIEDTSSDEIKFFKQYYFCLECKVVFSVYYELKQIDKRIEKESENYKSV